MRTRLFASIVFYGPLFLFAGCSGAPEDDTSELVPAGGLVVLDGEPVSNAAVQFVPTKGGSPAFGVTDDLGMFTLRNARGREGAEPGEYRVTISKFAQPDGTPIPQDADSGIIGSMGMEHLPENYSNFDRTELKAEIPATGSSDLYFELVTK
jgi:hypothetical protein